MEPKKLLVVAHTNLGTSLSGGDRIFLNLIKYWQKEFSITLLASPEAINLAKKFNLSSKIIPTLTLPAIESLNTLNLVFHHFSRLLSAIYFCLKNYQLFKKNQYLYTASDFYGDYIFGLFAKLFNPSINWICGYYLLAPSPFLPNSPYRCNHQFVRGLIYHLAQIPTIYFAKKMANYVFVTSQPDVNIFLNKRLTDKKTFVVQGGVNIPSLSSIKKMKPVSARVYDAVFLGRLHSQKGVVELIDIWNLVVKKIPTAKLIIIGDGELLPTIKQKITDLKLNKNIKLAGFLLGHNKFKLIKNSKIVVHPATYDSGGMAAAEAMAWGLPGVSYNLPALKTYYPTGMIKTRCFSQKQFSSNIIKLLTDASLYRQYSNEAINLTQKYWHWDNIFQNLFIKMFSK